MCAICGIHDARGVTGDDVERMRRTLVHRGPDGEGLFLGSTTALGHRRLSVIDLPGGAQPMSWQAPGHDVERSLQLVANAEIYNHVDLRARLEQRGRTFRTRSDVEVILQGYAEWGDDVVHHLDGMFAFALWDGARQRLLLARDRFGEKPLYYRWSEGRLSFASQPRALLALDHAAPSVDPVALTLYLALDYVPAPYGLFQGVRKLGAGERLVLENGQLRVERWWSFATSPKLELGKVEASRELRRLFEASVASRIAADVPVGVLLSGGVDSTLVAATAAAQGHRLPAFSVGFEEGAGYDETPYAKQVAEWLGLEHHQVTMTAAMAPGLVAQAAEAFDEPVADPAVLPMLLLSQLARTRVTVALGGDGADELFAGYDTFIAARLDAATSGVSALKSVLPFAAKRWPERGGHFSTAFRLRQFAQGLNRPPAQRALAWMLSGDEASITRLSTGRLPVEPLLRLLDGLGASTGDPVDDASRALVQIYLEGDLLPKSDRASMACGLEVRSPFLDEALATFAGRLPSRWKLRGLQRKHLLRHALRDRLGPVARRSKHGFRVPVGEWLNTRLRAEADALLLDPAPYRQLPLERGEVERLLRRHRSGRENLRKPLWNLLTLFAWARRWLP